MNDRHYLWALHPASINSSDMIVNGVDIYGVLDSAGNNLSQAPFSWNSNAPNKDRVFNKADPSTVYGLGHISRLSGVLRNHKQPLAIKESHQLREWRSAPIWTRPFVPSAHYLIPELTRFNFKRPNATAVSAMTTAVFDFDQYNEPDNNIFQIGNKDGRHYAIYSRGLSTTAISLVLHRLDKGPSKLYWLTLSNPTEGTPQMLSYVLGLLLVDDAPVPWVVIIDSNHTLWALRPNNMEPDDDIRGTYLVDPDEDDYLDLDPPFYARDIVDRRRLNLSVWPFGQSQAQGIIYELGKSDILKQALTNPMNDINPTLHTKWTKWETRRAYIE
ncbi:hypothetical protein F5884DRAFT_754202 [Xylogone sp. PMI_703]|nr:hypothetical protein F5884DRAFT_754202 [Xylogone sp. PMI_703]